MWEMTCICGKWFKYFRNVQKYVGNDVDLWEMAQIFGEMAELLDKRLKKVENDRDLGNGQNIWEMS